MYSFQVSIIKSSDFQHISNRLMQDFSEILRVLNHFDFAFAFLSDIKTNLFGPVFFTVFAINIHVFVICKNYFLFFARFKKVDCLESQSTQVDCYFIF